MSTKPYDQMTSLHDDSTYILGDLIMEGSLDGGDHPVVIDGQFNGDITAIDNFTGKSCTGSNECLVSKFIHLSPAPW